MSPKCQEKLRLLRLINTLVFKRIGTLRVRKANINDLSCLIEFTSEEAREAEGSVNTPDTLGKGISRALRDESVAIYWVLVDDNDIPAGSVSALREWSDWNAGYYWWIQSMYLLPSRRGKGYMSLLIEAGKFRNGISRRPRA